MTCRVLIAIAACLAVALPADAETMPDDAIPAMTLLTADSAEVSSDGDELNLVLVGTHPLVAVIGALDEDRRFHSFDVADFAEGWNTCNDLKDAVGGWHHDGMNALFEFAAGPDAGEGYRLHSPLYTAANSDDGTMVTEGPAGSVRLRLDDARHDGATATVRFVVLGGAIAEGGYDDVVLLAECLLTDGAT